MIAKKAHRRLFLFGGGRVELNLSNTIQIIAVITFAAGIGKLLIVNPLQKAIDSLSSAVNEMKDMLSRLDQEQKGIDKRLVVVEESTKSAHHRIDGIEGRA